MASLSIRNLDENTKKRLRIRAAENGRSMEAEARAILSSRLENPAPTDRGLGSAIHALFAPHGGADLEPLPREPIPDPPEFG